ncbi:MAG: hypothetical protein ABIK92_01840 [Pseudomonadota bacterium]
MNMKTYVEFKSDLFPAYSGEENDVNPHRWGKRLAEYIYNGLKGYAVPVEEIFSEDWGWVIPIKNDSFKLWIGCGNYDEYPDGFLCFIEPSKPFIRRFFKKIRTVEKVTEIANYLNNILSAESNIKEIIWWTADEFNNPKAEQTNALIRAGAFSD